MLRVQKHWWQLRELTYFVHLPIGMSPTRGCDISNKTVKRLELSDGQFIVRTNAGLRNGSLITEDAGREKLRGSRRSIIGSRLALTLQNTAGRPVFNPIEQGQAVK